MEPTAQEAAADADHRRAGLVIVGMSVALWWPAFTLGAWGALFFEQLLTVWVASTAGLIIVVTQPRGSGRRWVRTAALAVPSVWLLLAILDNSPSQSFAGFIVEVLGIVIGLLGLPFTLWTLVRVLWPELFSDFSWSIRLGVAGVVASLALGSFFLGVHQAAFLDCEDFDISGNSRPPGCVPAQVRATP